MSSARPMTPSSATDLWTETTTSSPGRVVRTSRRPVWGSRAPPGPKIASYVSEVTCPARPRRTAPPPPQRSGVSPRGETLKVQALGYDMTTGRMVPASELRRADLPTDGRIFYVNNNPIAAPAGHPVVRQALTRATDRLLGDKPAPEIQSTTGPGNLTAVLAAHARESLVLNAAPDFELLLDWELTAEPRWDLAYRDDARNWRNMGHR